MKLREVKEAVEPGLSRGPDLGSALFTTSLGRFVNSDAVTSLVVQRLRLCTAVQGAQVQPLVRGLDPTCCG